MLGYVVAEMEQREDFGQRGSTSGTSRAGKLVRWGSFLLVVAIGELGALVASAGAKEKRS